MNGPIAAIATSTATDAALSVIRMTGEGCHAALARCLRKNGKAVDTADIPNRTVVLCEMIGVDSPARLDVVTVILYRAPGSYTGEESAELICHGGRGVTRHVFLNLVAAGFSPAGAGDFTRRAFLNGKLDLAQAEAVSAATTAASAVAARAAAAGLSGETSERIHRMADRLVEILSLLEANLDLSEDGIDVVDRGRITGILDATSAELDELIRHAGRAAILSGSIRVALIGKPNVGKSTILNRLLGSARAIVSDAPGTTRDVVDGRIDLDSMAFEFLDTAGLRPTDDAVESAGVERAREAARSAHLVLHVIDANDIGAADLAVAAAIPHEPPRMLVVNKTDIARPGRADLAPFLSNGFSSMSIVEITAIRPDGMDSLLTALIEHGRRLFAGLGAAPVWISARQAECLLRARTSVARAAVAAIESGLTEEFLSADIREALDALAEFSGRKTADDVIDKIFESFCIGK